MSQKSAGPAEEHIGMAYMDLSNTIVLDLTARHDDGSVGATRLLCATGDPNYSKILDHLGGLRPGERKLVRPWP